VANITDQAKTILEKRYYTKDETKPEHLFKRIANNIALSEKEQEQDYWRNIFYNVMNNLEFMPSSPCLMNAGANHNLNQLSSCFILPLEDSMDGIYDALKWQALITKACGGTGFSFSKLRPNGSLVKGLPVASGPVSFMRVFDASTGAVKQGRRRGANMGALHVHHPDILEFIDCKNDNVSFPNFNISVAITHKFMEAVKNNTDYDLINPQNNKVIGKLNARMVWDRIFQNAWKTGDPGVIFIDRCNDDNSVPHLGEILSGNPCNEYVFVPFGSCNLGSVNIALCFKNGQIDWDKLKYLISVGVRFIDNMITMNELPLLQLKEMALKTRPIGLGIMGWHELLIQLGIPYSDQNALDLAELMSKTIKEYAIESSKNLAKERGVFPEWENSIWGKQKIEIRNSTLLSLAPNGTISIICDTTGGIEPLFSVAFTRNVESMDNLKLNFVNKYFEQIAKEKGFYSQELIDEIIQKGTVQGIKIIPKNIQNLFKTAQEISPETHVKMQAAWQKNVDLSISKTVNMPNDATVEDIKKVYELAYELGCKGVTIYRDGSKLNQPLTAGSSMSENNQIENKQYIKPKKRPKVTKAEVEEFNVGCGKLYITVSEVNEQLFETFTNLGTAGVCPGFSAGLSRMVSLALRSGIDPEDIIDQLTSVTCANCRGKKTDAKSCPDAYGKAIKRKFKQIIKEHQKEQKNEAVEIKEDKDILCPECGEQLKFSEGCNLCISCGFSKCK
jgi:ribonucleoside-diphosphate reductase alpha chain